MAKKRAFLDECVGRGWLGRIGADRHAEQCAATLERSTPSAVGEESEVADANQATGQDVKQEARRNS
jgi:hypothetical protein